MPNDLLIFIFGALLMVITPLLLLLHGFLRQHKEEADENSRRQENIRHAKARLAALQTDNTAQADDLQEQQDEIKAQLLADLQAQKEADTNRSPAVLGGIALCAFFLLLAPVLYAVYGTPAALTAAHANPTAAGTLNEHSGSMAEVIAQLQQRVEQQPNDGEGLTLLAASMTAMGRYSEAVRYYRRARAVLGDEPRLLIGLTEALIAGGGTPAETESTLSEALAMMPDEPYLLWIAGIWARDQGELEKALSLFESVTMTTTDPEALRVVREAIDEVNAAMGERPTADAATTTTQEENAKGELQVVVQLSPDFAERAAASDVVFIFARAANGPPMPLAVQRVRVADLPVTVALNDSMAMMPNLALSNFSAYEVVARISQSGIANPTSGDIFGTVAAQPGARVTVLINEVTP